MQESKYCPYCKTRLMRKAGERKYCPRCMAYFYITIQGMDIDSPLLKKED